MQNNTTCKALLIQKDVGKNIFEMQCIADLISCMYTCMFTKLSKPF